MYCFFLQCQLSLALKLLCPSSAFYVVVKYDQLAMCANTKNFNNSNNCACLPTQFPQFLEYFILLKYWHIVPRAHSITNGDTSMPRLGTYKAYMVWNRTSQTCRVTTKGQICFEECIAMMGTDEVEYMAPTAVDNEERMTWCQRHVGMYVVRHQQACKAPITNTLIKTSNVLISLTGFHRARIGFYCIR